MFFRYLWKRKKFVLLYMVLATTAAILLTMFTLQIANIFSLAQVGNYSGMLKLFVLMFFWYIFIRFLDYLTELSAIYAVNLTRQDIKRDLFAAVIHKQLPDFAQRNSGEYIAEFTNDIVMLETKFLIPAKELFSYLVTIISVGAAIVTIDVHMVLVLFAGIVLCIVIPLAVTRYTSSKMLRFIQRFDTYVQYLKDRFCAFFTIKNYAIEDQIVRQFSSENHEVERAKYDAEFALVVMNNIVGRMSWLIELLVVTLGLVGVLQGGLMIGSVFSAYFLAGQLGHPMQSLANRISMIRSTKGIEQKFGRLYAMRDRIAPAPLSVATDTFGVCLKQVSLTIKGKKILDDVSCTFEPGKKYLILGDNGSGKSTLAKLLKNTFTSYSGELLLGGYELRTPEGTGLSRRVSYSNETVSLFSDTVRNNILLFRDLPEEDLMHTVRQAELSISLDRMIGDGGRYLSSGERRKLELARALIGNPQILILDEIVSTLDIETAYEVERLILGFEKHTVVMISNAFSGQLLDRYDKIFLMDHGHIVACGTHQELLTASSAYRRIYDLRCGGKEETADD